MDGLCDGICRFCCCFCCENYHDDNDNGNDIQTCNCCITCCCCCCFEESIFDNYSSKSIETMSMFLLIVNIGIIIYLFSQIGISYISPYTITLIFLIIIVLAICLLFVILFSCWRKSGKIKTSKKETATTMAKIAIFLTLLCLVTSGISEYLVINDTQNEKCKEIEKRDKEVINSNAYLRRKYDICQEKFKDTNSKATFSTFSFIEFFCFINSILFCKIKDRITLGIDFVRPNEDEAVVQNQFQVSNPSSADQNYPKTQDIPYQPENGIPQNPIIIIQPQQLYTYQQNINVYQYPNNQNEKINNAPQNQMIYNTKKVVKKQKNNIGNKTTNDNNQNSIQSNMMSSQRIIQGKFI
jgi:hypothetical protein